MCNTIYSWQLYFRTSSYIIHVQAVLTPHKVTVMLKSREDCKEACERVRKPLKDSEVRRPGWNMMA